jgi:hypothetical protein
MAITELEYNTIVRIAAQINFASESDRQQAISQCIEYIMPIRYKNLNGLVRRILRRIQSTQPGAALPLQAAGNVQAPADFPPDAMQRIIDALHTLPPGRTRQIFEDYLLHTPVGVMCRKYRLSKAGIYLIIKKVTTKIKNRL